VLAPLLSDFWWQQKMQAQVSVRGKRENLDTASLQGAGGEARPWLATEQGAAHQRSLDLIVLQTPCGSCLGSSRTPCVPRGAGATVERVGGPQARTDLVNEKDRRKATMVHRYLNWK
jgi:hypothetical protein